MASPCQECKNENTKIKRLRAEVFEAGWHDWIVMAEGQLAAFTRYVRENPRRAFLREENRRYFTSVRRVSFAGREWFAYGNTALLDLPVIEPFRCSRRWEDGGPEWRAAMSRAERLGPGGAGCGTFMSLARKPAAMPSFRPAAHSLCSRPKVLHRGGIRPATRRRFARRGACSSFRCGSRSWRGRITPRSTSVATRWEMLY